VTRPNTVWRNRIVGYTERPASTFLANPLNWRIHPTTQQQAMDGVLGDLGWIDTVVENVTTGNLLDGHMRVMRALRHGDDTPVPVILVQLSPAEEALALATLDPIGAMAATDKDPLDSTLREVHTTDVDVQKLLSDIATQKGLYNEDTRKKDAAGEEKVRQLAADETPDGSEKRSRFQQGYGVMITVDNETQQEELFNRLQAEGWTCRAVTL
jgi:hypothetical protein